MIFIFTRLRTRGRMWDLLNICACFEQNIHSYHIIKDTAYIVYKMLYSSSLTSFPFFSSGSRKSLSGCDTALIDFSRGFRYYYKLPWTCIKYLPLYIMQHKSSKYTSYIYLYIYIFSDTTYIVISIRLHIHMGMTCLLRMKINVNGMLRITRKF